MAKYTFQVDYSELVLRTQEVTVEANSLAEAEELVYETDDLDYGSGKNIVNVNTEIEEITCIDCPADEDTDGN